MTSGLPAPKFQLIYRGTDISGDLDPETTEVTYTDHLHGTAHEIDVTVHDRDGRWKGAWLPEHGDKMELTIFDGSGGILPCGTFEMDEPNVTGGRDGDFMTIRGLAAPISKSIRTKKTEAFEKQSLEDVVKKKAGALDLSLQGKIDELFFDRVSQRRERDLEFVKRLAEETGHYFNLLGQAIVFTNFASVDGLAPVNQIFHGDRQLIDYDFKFQSSGTYSKGKASYLAQNSGEAIEYEEDDPLITTGDTLRITGERLESAGHARARVKSGLHFANRNRFHGAATLVGSASLVAGNTAALIGFGQYSGTRVINSSSHTLDRSGYTTTVELVDARK